MQRKNSSQAGKKKSLPMRLEDLLQRCRAQCWKRWTHGMDNGSNHHRNRILARTIYPLHPTVTKAAKLSKAHSILVQTLSPMPSISSLLIAMQEDATTDFEWNRGSNQILNQLFCTVSIISVSVRKC